MTSLKLRYSMAFFSKEPCHLTITQHRIAREMGVYFARIQCRHRGSLSVLHISKTDICSTDEVRN